MARIILIDDDEFLGAILVQALTDVGHTVTLATNGFDGVALYRKESADVILTDITMPHGGLPTIRVLREEFPSLPIIAMSGNPKHLEVAGAIGANRILPKPFSVEQLAAAVAESIAART